MCVPGGISSPSISNMFAREKWPGVAGMPVSGMMRPIEAQNDSGHVPVSPETVHPGGVGAPDLRIVTMRGPVTVAVPLVTKKSFAGGPGIVVGCMLQAVPWMSAWNRPPLFAPPPLNMYAVS